MLECSIEFGNLTCELGLAQRAVPNDATGYVFSVNAANGYVQLYALDPDAPGGYRNLAVDHPVGFAVEVGVQYCLRFWAEGTGVRGELRTSTGELVTALDAVDDAYRDGAIAAWTRRAVVPGSIAATFGHLAVDGDAFPHVYAYPAPPATFVQSEDGTGLRIVDPSGGFAVCAGFAVLEPGVGTRLRVRARGCGPDGRMTRPWVGEIYAWPAGATQVLGVRRVGAYTATWQFTRSVLLEGGLAPELTVDGESPDYVGQPFADQVDCEYPSRVYVGDAWAVARAPSDVVFFSPLVVPASGVVAS